MGDYDEIIQEQNLLQGQQDDMLFQQQFQPDLGDSPFQQQYQQDLADQGFQQSQNDALSQWQYLPDPGDASFQQQEFMLLQQSQDDGLTPQQYQQDLADQGFQQSQNDALSQWQYQQQLDDDALSQWQYLQQLDADTLSPQPQVDVLDEFRELQGQYGLLQEEVPVEYARGAEDVDEPGRIPELDSGYDPSWEPEGGHRFPAESKGEWVEGGRGDGYWQPYDPGAYGLEAGDSIPFREGVPDFSDYAFPTPSGEPGVFDVFGLTGDASEDYNAAIEQLADQEGMTFRECQEWLSENNLRVHHYGGDEMQLVDERLHGALGHQGSATELRDG